MSKFFKAQILNDEGFPMPEPMTPPRTSHGDGVSMPDEQEVAAAQDTLGDVLRAIRSELGPEIDKLTDKVRTDAFKEGYDSGIDKARSEMTSLLSETIKTLQAAQQERIALSKQHQNALRDLALKITRQVIARSFEADPGIVNQVISESLADLEPDYDVVVRVNPQDMDLVEEKRADFERLVGADGTLAITADETVDRGGVIISSEVGEADARVHSRLAIIEHALIKASGQKD